MMTIDDKDKKKKEKQQNTPTQTAQTEQTTTTATTTAQPQQPQGPIPWETSVEEINVDEGVFNDYLRRQKENDAPISAAEDKYLTSMNNIYNLLNKNSEKTKATLKKQPVADAFNMLGTAVGKLSEVASNATFSGRVAPKKVDSSDIAKQGNALLKKSYELPQYLQAIDSEMLQNEAKKLQNDYSVKMNKLQRQQQYLQNAYKIATTKEQKEYVSQAYLDLENQKLEAEKAYRAGMLKVAQQNANSRSQEAYNEANKQDLGFDKLYVDNKPYPVEEGFIYDILNNSDLFTDEKKERLQKASAATIRGEIQTELDRGRRPKYYKNKDIKVTQKIPFPFMETLQGQGKKMITNY